MVLKRGLGPDAVFMNGAPTSSLRSALPGDENAARLRTTVLNHVEDRAHVGLCPMILVEPGEPAELPTHISGFFLPFRLSETSCTSEAQLID